MSGIESAIVGALISAGFSSKAAGAIFAGLVFITKAAVGIGLSVLVTSALATGINTPDLAAQRRTVTSVSEPDKWIIGRARVGSVLVSWVEIDYGRDGVVKNIASDSRGLTTVQVLCKGPCDALERMWVDGQEYDLTDNTRWDISTHADGGINFVPQGSNNLLRAGEGYLLIVTAYLAADGNQGRIARDFSRGIWTTDHKLTGYSYVVLRLYQHEYGQDLSRRFWTKFPDVHFLVRGLKFTWPGQTTPRWTNNAAAVRYWWLRNRRGIPDSAIDTDSFRAAYALCEESITVANTGIDNYPTEITRYVIDGVVSSGDDVVATEAQMDFAWQGHVVESGGVHLFRPGTDRPAVDTITPESIRDVGGIQTAPAIQDRANRLSMKLQQSDYYSWLDVQLPVVNDDTAQARDGVVLEKELTPAAFVSDPIRGVWLLGVQVKRARNNSTIRLTLMPDTNARWHKLVPSDRVKLTLPDFGLEDFLCDVISVANNEDFSVTVELLEAQENVFDFAIPENINIPEGLTNAILAAADVTGLAASVVLGQSFSGSTQFTLQISWDAAPYPQTAVRYRITGAWTYVVVDGANSLFVGLTTSRTVSYEVQARHVERDGRAGDWGNSVVVTVTV